MANWFVYLLRCADDTLYAGVTVDLERRLREHNGEYSPLKGAKYTKIRRPVVLVYYEACTDRSAAQIREAAIRKLSRSDKCRLIDNTPL